MRASNWGEVARALHRPAGMPGWFRHLLHWSARPEVLIPLTVGSAMLLVVTAVFLPKYLQRLPPDYFSRRDRRDADAASKRRSLPSVLATALRNVVGALLVLCGLLMLILPGQGVLTLLAGLMLADFPGKKPLERRLLSLRPVRHAVDSLRARAGKPPFQLPA